MDWKKMFGRSTLIFAILMVFFGLSSQVLKNYHQHECGLSFLMVILPLAVYVSRSLYSFTIKSWYIFVPDVIGVILSLILLTQYILY